MILLSITKSPRTINKDNDTEFNEIALTMFLKRCITYWYRIWDIFENWKMRMGFKITAKIVIPPTKDICQNRCNDYSNYL